MDWTIVAGASGALLGSGLTLGGVWLTAEDDRNLAQELLSDVTEDVTSRLDAEGGDGKNDGNDREGGRP